MRLAHSLIDRKVPERFASEGQRSTESLLAGGDGSAHIEVRAPYGTVGAGKDTIPLGSCQHLPFMSLTMGRRIKRARLLKGAWSEPPIDIRQADIARALRVSEGLVTQWESDHKKPGRDYLEPLAGYLGCEVRWLLSGNGPMYADEAQLRLVLTNRPALPPDEAQPISGVPQEEGGPFSPLEARTQRVAEAGQSYRASEPPAPRPPPASPAKKKRRPKKS